MHDEAMGWKQMQRRTVYRRQTIRINGLQKTQQQRRSNQPKVSQHLKVCFTINIAGHMAGDDTLSAYSNTAIDY
jgi:hypothetical protein